MVAPLVPVRPTPRRRHPFRAEIEGSRPEWLETVADLLDRLVTSSLIFVLIIVLIQIVRLIGGGCL
jgi:hypothetical protein